MARGEYLLEVRTEEIPARMLGPGVRQLGRRVFGELMGRGLGPKEVETASTPRRLVLVLRGLPEREPDREEQTMGPPVRVAYDGDGKPTKALTGFAERAGVAPEDLQRVQTDKGEYLAAVRQIEGRPAAAALAELVPRVLHELSWPRTMRWGSRTGPWVRPVHGVVSLLDGEVVPFDLFGVAAGRETAGHPILSPEPFAVDGVEDYRRRLGALGIVVGPEARKRRLLEVLEQRASGMGGELVADGELLDRLVAMCEIPGVVVGQFDAGYLELPREVLIASQRDHQSAFTVEREGKLLPAFLTVMDRPDDPQGLVRSGNEWVVAARLADARFFYQEDQKVPLAERTARLAGLIFHEKLGSMADKSERLGRLADALARDGGLGESERQAVQQAVPLLKVDLTAEMVKEFTSLQGVMGGVYAREEGLPEAVWQAIYDHYLPAAGGDPVPRSPAGQVCALADRLDSLVGIVGLGLVPSGSKDPFGLRRAAQAACRILLEGELALDLESCVGRAIEIYGELLPRERDEILGDLRPFLQDRIRHLLGQRGLAYDEIEAGLAAGWTRLSDLARRVEAVREVRRDDDFLSVSLSAKRIANILKQAPADLELDPSLFEQDEERRLHEAFEALALEVEKADAAGRYEESLRRIAALAPVLERFFDEVMVMHEDEKLRRNRLALLAAIDRAVSRTARLTELVVDKADYRARAQAD